MVEKDPAGKELIQFFRQTKPKKTFESFYDRFAPFFYSKCLLMTGNESGAQHLIPKRHEEMKRYIE
jgi:hypothetical protein